MRPAWFDEKALRRSILEAHRRSSADEIAEFFPIVRRTLAFRGWALRNDLRRLVRASRLGWLLS